MTTIPTKQASLPSYPMRVNKYLAFKKYCTRHEADLWIQAGRVTINAKVAVVGDPVAESDVVEVCAPERTYRYYAYNKPRGIITHSPQGNEVSIGASIGLTEVFPVGRLDKDSSGLILLTNDGRITDALLNPKYEHEKEYAVTCLDTLPLGFTQRMEAGVDIGGYITEVCRLTTLSKKSFSIILTEGKKHQIRRMCGTFGQSVTDLTRTRIMNIELGRLQPGSYREITSTELDTFLRSIGFNRSK